MQIIHSLFLSIVQGITEFLPISSSGHLILFPKFFGWDDQGLAFDAIIHLATSAAVIVYYRSYIKTILQGAVKKEKRALGIIGLILVSAIPAVIAGLFLKDFIAGSGRTVLVVMMSLFVWGIGLILVEFYSQRKKHLITTDNLQWHQALLIGCAQALALIPGTSRSGITISAAILFNMKKEEAVKFSFLMGVPVILGAGGISFLDLLKSDADIHVAALSVALVGAFLSGLAAIHILKLVVAKRGLLYFGIYRILLALFLFFAVL